MALNVTTEEVKVQGENLLKTVQNLIREGNVRKITIKDKNNQVLVELPLTIGVVGVVLAPVLAAVGALAALVTECTITVERAAAPKKTPAKKSTKKKA